MLDRAHKRNIEIVKNNGYRHVTYFPTVPKYMRGEKQVLPSTTTSFIKT